MDLFEPYNTHKLTHIMNPPVVVSDLQWVQAKINIYA
jgi:hypothetical protein